MNLKDIMQSEINWTHEGQMSLYASQGHQIQTESRLGASKKLGRMGRPCLIRSWENGSHDSNETVLIASELQEPLV